MRTERERNERENVEALLTAVELLLSDIQNERLDLDRRERELQRAHANYEARLKDLQPMMRRADVIAERGGELSTNNESRQNLFGDTDDDGGDADHYGAISNAVLDIMAEYGKKVNGPFISSQLEMRRVPIRAKSYTNAVRTAIRRLNETGKIRRVGVGWYRLAKPAEPRNDRFPMAIEQ